MTELDLVIFDEVDQVMTRAWRDCLKKEGRVLYKGFWIEPSPSPLCLGSILEAVKHPKESNVQRNYGPPKRKRF